MLVAALRRSERLAVAIEARGFSPERPRTHWHEQRWEAADSATVLAGALLTLAGLAGGRLLGPSC
jgi:energy-coupling factor transporter transmembrane protein EcfT